MLASLREDAVQVTSALDGLSGLDFGAATAVRSDFVGFGASGTGRFSGIAAA